MMMMIMMTAGLQIWWTFGLNIEEQTRWGKNISILRNVSEVYNGQYLSF
jgi:hypothetical protein